MKKLILPILLASTAITPLFTSTAYGQGLYNLATLDEYNIYDTLRGEHSSVLDRRLQLAADIRNLPLQAYDRDRYKALEMALIEAETNCYNAGDLTADGAKYERYEAYIEAYTALYAMGMDASTPDDVARQFRRDHVYPSGEPNFLDNCPPRDLTLHQPRLETYGAEDNPDRFGSREDLNDANVGYANESYVEESYEDDYDTEDISEEEVAGIRRLLNYDPFADTSDDELDVETSTDDKKNNDISLEVQRAYREWQGSGYGVDIGSGETFVGESDDRLDGYGFRAEVEGTSARLSAYWMGLSGERRAQILAGSSDVGLVYHDEAANGATGLGLGASGLDVDTKTNYDSYGAEVILFFEKPLDIDTPLRSSFKIGVRKDETDVKASVTTPSFSDIYSESEQTVEDFMFYGALGLEKNYPLSDRWSLDLGARVDFGYMDSELDSRQRNVCGQCGADQQDFTVNIKDDDSNVFFGGGIDIYFTYDVTQTFEMSFGGAFSGISRAGYADNPETGDDLFIDNQPTKLSFKPAYMYILGVKASKQW